jgi:hypothetical protein
LFALVRVRIGTSLQWYELTMIRVCKFWYELTVVRVTVTSYLNENISPWNQYCHALGCFCLCILPLSEYRISTNAQNKILIMFTCLSPETVQLIHETVTLIKMNACQNAPTTKTHQLFPQNKSLFDQNDSLSIILFWWFKCF